MNETQTFERSSSAGIGRPGGAQLQPGQDLVKYLTQYARERPEVTALWCFGLGFVLGWKLKPW